MFEGGAWQAGIAERFLATAGIGLQSAKGRPHEKLIENYWNRLWSPLSLQDGQIGRYRGEMERENAEFMRVRDGRVDPRPEAVLDAGVMGSYITALTWASKSA